MARYLKSVAAVTVVVGVLLGIGFFAAVFRDEQYKRATLLRERNPGNILYDSEFRIAEARRVFLVYSAVACFSTALIGGSLLWGLAGLHAKLDRRGGPDS